MIERVMLRDRRMSSTIVGMGIIMIRRIPITHPAIIMVVFFVQSGSISVFAYDSAMSDYPVRVLPVNPYT